MTVQSNDYLNPDTPSPNDITVVLAALNEEEAIGEVIDKLREEGFENIIVIDGYSTDGTINIAVSKKVKVIQQHWEGKAGAIKTALDYVLTPYVVFMDADGTYSPSDIYKLLIHAKKYVEVIGKRDRDGISRLHKIGNSLINKLFSLVFSTDVGDVLSGMYLIKTDVARQFSLNSKSFEIEVEIASQALQRGKVTYVPIRYGKRKGRAKLSSYKDGLKILLYILKMAKDQNPVLFYSILVTSLVLPGSLLLGYTILEYMLHGIFHSGYALIAVTLILIGMQGLTTMGISSMIKRLEYSISKEKR